METVRNDRQMMIDTLVAQTGAETGGAPEDERLQDYFAGRLGEDEADRVRRWIAAHPETAGRLLEMREFAAAQPRAEGEPSDLATRGAWRDFERRLETEKPKPTPRRSPRLLAAVAALFCLATVGLALEVWRLRSALDRPVANLQTLVIQADARTGGGPGALEIQSGEPLRVALYPPPAPEGCELYRVDVHRADGSKAHRIEGLHLNRGALDFLLPGVPGSYTLEVFACGEHQARSRVELNATE